MERSEGGRDGARKVRGWRLLAVVGVALTFCLTVWWVIFLAARGIVRLASSGG